MSPISLTNIRDLLMPGLNFMAHAKKPLTVSKIPFLYPHLRYIFDYLQLKTVGDLHNLPKRIETANGLYETQTVFAGRVYPQGWGRGPGGAAAEPPPEPDGMVDSFREEDNELMRSLKREIESFITESGWYK